MSRGRSFWNVEALYLPKAGHSEEEYEDAFHTESFARRRPRLRAAVADGATGSSYSREWAGMLTRAFVQGNLDDPDSATRTVETLAGEWQEGVGSRPLPWYAEVKASKGAFASLLGLDLLTLPDHSSQRAWRPFATSWRSRRRTRQRREGRWRAVAVGDSCLFQLRRGQVVAQFPVTDSSDFGNHPTLISSRMDRNAEAWAEWAETKGRWTKGDVFLLATDAIAERLMREAEQNGADPHGFRLLADPQTRESPDGAAWFARWIEAERDARRLRNDDVTCVVIRL